ncbi:hypothetical protein [Halobellus ruber]|uniref:Uncharacterized protein n=1 Tax=Halobellus ruber TaxID=2761102 RepID=A0A7J9SMX9_9EURY|nr:hypothetical protein [Halobellus ruber]MBB6646481.1 hypothetical protein [Halobellus ruber]
MAYTDHSDVYGALHEEGINRVVTHLQHKRPSLFNYGTARVVAGAYAAAEVPPPEYVDVRHGSLPPCEAIPYAPEVRDRRWDNPLMTEEEPLPVVGTDGLVGMDYAVQVTDLGIDFAPPTEELSFKDQQYAANASVCAGLGCPGDVELDGALEAIEQFRSYVERREDFEMDAAMDDEALLAEFGLPAVPQADRLRCFCLDVKVVGTVSMVDRPTVEGPLTVPQSPTFGIDDIRLTDLETIEEFPLPAGFVHSLECYIEVFLRLGVFPSLADTIERTVQQALAMQNPVLTLGGLTATVELPTSGAVPYNPAIEADELRVYVDLDVDATGGGP